MTGAEVATTAHDVPVTVVRPRRVHTFGQIAETWRFRRFVPLFGMVLLRKQYQRTWLGWLWLPLRPVLDIVPRILIFGSLLNVPVPGAAPYAVFFLIGNTAWRLFSETAYWATRSTELGRRWLRRMYLPRLSLLLGGVAPGLLSLGFYTLITGLFAVYYAINDGTPYLVLSWNLLLLPLALLILIVQALCIGLWLAPLAPQARDVRFGLGYALGFWSFFTPVIYPLSLVPSDLRDIASLNPITAPVEAIRLSLLGNGDVTTVGVISALTFVVLVGLGGLRYFARREAVALDM